MEPSLSSIPASKTLRVRKYAAKFRLVDHVGAHQRFYLRLLCAKRAVWSGVPEFAAYFRFENSEMRGKTEICRPDPGFMLPRPAVLYVKIWLRSAVLASVENTPLALALGFDGFETVAYTGRLYM